MVLPGVPVASPSVSTLTTAADVGLHDDNFFLTQFANADNSACSV